MSSYREPECERYMQEANQARGFFGADCGTWFGGIAKNCKSQDQAGKVNRNNCYLNKGLLDANQESTEMVIMLLKWGAALFIVYMVLKWYLK